jgi:hypothetical protein
MNVIRMTVGLLLGAAVVVGCNNGSTPTASSGERASFAVSGGSGQTATVLDDLGDVGKKTPAWLDIVSASITRTGQSFIFEAELAAPIPDDPALDPLVPKQTDHLGVFYAVDSDSTTAPVGFSFSKNQGNISEFFLGTGWNPTGSFGLGTGFIGLLLDRRPLLTGGQATLTAITFTVQGTHVSAVVDAAMLGDPATFAWAAFSELDMHDHPPDEWCCEDFAPDITNGVPLATWPQ